MQFDLTLLVIWYVVPLLIIGGRAALAGYKAKKKRDELRRLERKITPFSTD